MVAILKLLLQVYVVVINGVGEGGGDTSYSGVILTLILRLCFSFLPDVLELEGTKCQC